MQRKTNILFALSSLCNAGAETQALDLINGLDNDLFNKTLVIFKDKQEQLARVDSKNIHYFRLFRKFKLDFTIVFRLAKILSDQKIEVVHCTNQFPMLIIWLAILFVKEKPEIVVALHTTVNVGLKEELLDQLLYRWIFRGCSKILFVCETQAAHWTGRFPEISRQSEVVYNGVDEQFYSRENPDIEVESLKAELAHSVKDFKECVVITCIAGFRPEKAHDILIAAFSQLPANCCLLLAGDGGRREEIEALVAHRGLRERVVFLGNINDVRPLLSISDVTVLASTAVETFSIAMLESMAMNVPMVASDVGGLKEAIIPGITGELVPAGDTSALADALAGIVKNKKTLSEMGRQARISVEQRFTKSGMIRITEQYLLASQYQ